MLEPSMLKGGRRSRGSEMEIDRQTQRRGIVPIKPSQNKLTIDILPDDALLTIFLLYNDVSSSELSWWQPLVHVCCRWRRVIFASPVHLNLTLVCTFKTPARESLDIWPPIPIALHSTSYGHDENIFAAMERPDRITDIRFEKLMFRSFEQLTRMMDSPFPALTYLSLGGNEFPNFYRDHDFVLRDGFLGGSAPSLRTFILCNSRFPTLPRLLLSATQLVTLRLSWVTTLSVIPLWEIVACLTALPKLKQLDITHLYKFSDSDQSPLPARVVLPSLTSFYFYGISGPLEDFVARIDAPMLQTLSLKLGDVGRVPQLLRFIDRAEKLKPPIQAAFVFGQRGPLLKFMPSDGFEFSTRNHDPFDLLAPIVLLCLALSPLLSHVERLDFHCDQRSPSSQGLVDPEHWLEIFRPFTTVQSLRVPKKVWSRVGPALQALAEEGATEVFPKLRTLFLEEPFEEDKKSIESLISARRLTVRPYSDPYPDAGC